MSLCHINVNKKKKRRREMGGGVAPSSTGPPVVGVGAVPLGRE